MASRLSELGFYTLPGHTERPRDLIDEVRFAEEIGLGAVFISERWNTKEAGAIAGAVGAVSDNIAIATAATNHTTRHPVITASYASTMHRLTGGRFTLGLGRGIGPLFEAYGLPQITTAQMEDFAGLMRRVWRGETVINHDGPAGRYPMLRLLGSSIEESIPLGLTAWGPRTCSLGGRAFDQVVLHTFFDDSTVERCVSAVHLAAEKAGRDPASVVIWSVLATIPPETDSATRLIKVTARLASYLQGQGYGEALVAANQWDAGVLKRFRADPIVQGFEHRPIDQYASTDQLEYISRLLPPSWSATAAEGSAQDCVSAVRHQFELGAGGVILHGCTPRELAPVVAAYRLPEADSSPSPTAPQNEA